MTSERILSLSLQEELRGMDNRVREAVRQADENGIIAAEARKRVLPVLIMRAQMDECRQELSEFDGQVAIAQEEKRIAVLEHKAAQEELERAKSLAAEKSGAMGMAVTMVSSLKGRISQLKKTIAGYEAQLETFITGKDPREPEPVVHGLIIPPVEREPFTPPAPPVNGGRHTKAMYDEHGNFLRLAVASE